MSAISCSGRSDPILDTSIPTWVGKFVGEQIFEWCIKEPVRRDLEEPGEVSDRFECRSTATTLDLGQGLGA